MQKVMDVPPHDLLLPSCPNHVWHMDLTCIRILWFRFTAAAILDGFSRRLLALKVFMKVPKQINTARLVRIATREFGKPGFLITDHGTQFGKQFHQSLHRRKIHHVKGRVRAPYLNGKMERAFRTFKLWWNVILCGLSRTSIQRNLDTTATGTTIIARTARLMDSRLMKHGMQLSFQSRSRSAVATRSSRGSEFAESTAAAILICR